MKITKQRLKQIIQEELNKLREGDEDWPGYLPPAGHEEHDERLKDWVSGHTGDPNDPLLSTVRRGTEKRRADLDAAITLVSAMENKELEQLQQHVTSLLAAPDTSSSDSDDSDDSNRLHLRTQGDILGRGRNTSRVRQGAVDRRDALNSMLPGGRK